MNLLLTVLAWLWGVFALPRAELRPVYARSGGTTRPRVGFGPARYEWFPWRGWELTGYSPQPWPEPWREAQARLNHELELSSLPIVP